VLSDLGTAETLKPIQSKVTYYSGGYGYQISQGERGGYTREAGEDFLNQHKESIDWVLAEFGSHSSSALELESTLVYVDRESARKSETVPIEVLAQRVRDVKPRFRAEYILEKASPASRKRPPDSRHRYCFGTLVRKRAKHCFSDGPPSF
jgi:hypothetical protein